MNFLDFSHRENGGGWTRTSEVRRRGIYSPLQLPLCDTPEESREKVCWQKDLNPQPSAYKADALPLSYTSDKELTYSELPILPQLFISPSDLGGV